MKKILCILGLFLFSVSANATVVVPKNTEVKIAPKRDVTSRHVPRTYEIKSVIQDDVFVNNHKIFATGDNAILKISEHQKARCLGRARYIKIDGGYAFDTKGNKQPIIVTQEFTAPNDKAIWKIFPFNKGPQVIIYPNNVFNTKTKREFKY